MRDTTLATRSPLFLPAALFYTWLMHAHAHAHGQHTSRVLRVSSFATLLYIALLIVAGVRAHSLALLSEAGHNVSDFLALLLSLAAVYIQLRPATSTKTFGYQRAGVLAALFNSATLVILSFWILWEAVRRLYAPVDVHPKLMIEVAAAGVLMNGLIALFLWRSAAHDVNIRSAFLHMLGDTLSTAAVIVGGWAIAITHLAWIDPVLSFGIAIMIIWSSFGILRESLNILLEGTPIGLNLDDLNSAIAAVDGVNDVHDLHVWSIGSESHAMSCHIAIADIPPSQSDLILRGVNDMLRERFHIHHTTIQFEAAECEIAHGCVIPVVEDTHDHGHSHGHSHGPTDHHSHPHSH